MAKASKKRADVILQRLGGKGPFIPFGQYDVMVVIRKSNVKRTANGRTYMIASVDEMSDTRIYVDGLNRRMRVKLELRVDISEEKARLVKQERALRAYRFKSPILI